MLENRFEITVAGLTEISRRLILHTRRFVIASAAIPIGLILAGALLMQWVSSIPPVLMGGVTLILLVFFFSTLSKTPARMSAQIYSGMKPEVGEPVMHTKLSDDGVVLLDDSGEEARTYPFDSIRLIFGTDHYLVALDRDNRAVYWKKDAFCTGSFADLRTVLQDRCKTAKFARGIA